MNFNFYRYHDQELYYASKRPYSPSLASMATGRSCATSMFPAQRQGYLTDPYGASRYSPPEYPFAMANPYASKFCTPQTSWQNEEDNRSRSTSPQTQGLCSTSSCSSGPAPPLSHPPIHNTATTYSLPGSYLASVVPAAVHGYPQSLCGSYSPTESLYPRTDHVMRPVYQAPLHNSWQSDGTYSYH